MRLLLAGIAHESNTFAEKPTDLDEFEANGFVHSGASILLTTQYLEEADRLADDIVIIDHGLAIARGSADDLKEQAGGQRLEVVLTHPEHLDRAAVIVQGFGEDEVQIDARRSRVMTPVLAAPRCAGRRRSCRPCPAPTA